MYAVPIQAVTIKRDMKMNEGGESEGGAPAPAQNAAPQSNAKKMQEKIVYTVVDGAAKSVVVETGISDDRYVQVKSGLTGEEDVVIGSYRAISRELSDGKKVKVEEQKKITGPAGNEGKE